MVRLSVVVILASCLGGCGVLGSSPQAKRSLEQLVESTPLNASRDTSPSSPRSAMAMLPPNAGKIQKITGQVFADGTQQLIGYDQSVTGMKSNEISITLAKPASTTRLDQPAGRPAPRDRPTEAAIRTTLASDFPRMQMRIVAPPRSNDYGVYGLAAGQRADGVRCIYAWQWIEPLKSADDGTIASVRIRLCRAGVTLDQLAEFVDHLAIDSAQRDVDVQAAVADPIVPPQMRKPKAAAEAAPAKPTAMPALRRLATSVPAPLLALQAGASAEAAPEPDPALPAAAYRGPSALARTASQ